ncbi:MAG: PAS domain S-box protein [Verrucomicrobiota bacterium]|nr:PAS domain S-box protein [Verrucomicrobiota bacterium]
MNKKYSIKYGESSQYEIGKLMTALEQSANAIVITNAEGQIDYLNPAFVTLTGFSIHENAGNNVSLLKCKSHTPSFYKNIEHTICDGQTWTGKVFCKCKNKRIIPVEASFSPVYDPKQQNIIGFVGVAIDITEQERV